MNMLFPHLTQFEENRREFEREFRLRQQIRAARAVRRAQRPPRLTALTARLRRALQPDECDAVLEQW
jgi:hypothetical protein